MALVASRARQATSSRERCGEAAQSDHHGLRFGTGQVRQSGYSPRRSANGSMTSWTVRRGDRIGGDNDLLGGVDGGVKSLAILRQEPNQSLYSRWAGEAGDGEQTERRVSRSACSVFPDATKLARRHSSEAASQTRRRADIHFHRKHRDEPAAVECWILLRQEWSGAFSVRPAEVLAAQPYCIAIPPPNVTAPAHGSRPRNPPQALGRFDGYAARTRCGCRDRPCRDRHAKLVDWQPNWNARARARRRARGVMKRVWERKPSREARSSAELRCLGCAFDWCPSA